MGTTDSSDDRRRVIIIAASVLAVVLLGLLIRGLWSQPQLTSNEEVFTTVDALFTALTTRDSKRLSDCATRLDSYRDEGSIPKSAAKKLDAIIHQAQSGQWESSAKTLYDFMLAQRRGS
ncbi:hypothetical protein [Schlesneria paludicola]|uniref:hypothetical protein n=1 Tax=Schlesneria paludicola TaxID=360056 RepID=UPI000299F957|nr:hypothetical protein [Schlesneria paludicola]